MFQTSSVQNSLACFQDKIYFVSDVVFYTYPPFLCIGSVIFLKNSFFFPCVNRYGTTDTTRTIHMGTPSKYEQVTVGVLPCSGHQFVLFDRLVGFHFYILYICFS